MTIVKLLKDYKPFPFFSVIALLLFGIGAVPFISIFTEYLKIGMVPRFPTLFVSVCFMILSALTFICGLILDTVAKFNRKDYEIKLNMIKLVLDRRDEK